MALIICKTCGKKVSDTAKACVHCGEPMLTEETILAVPPPEAKKQAIHIETDTDTMVQFKSLGEGQQEDLVHAFWEDDKIAMHYQKKKLILARLRICFWFPLLFLPGICTVISFFVLKWQPQSPNFFIFILLFDIVCPAFFGLKALLFKIIDKLTVGRKEKRIAYIKRFHIWAKTKKQIDYTPIFARDTDAQMFEQIDIDTFKL